MNKKIYLIIKRICSFISALAAIILLSPLFIFLCIWIIIDDGFPVTFTQKRVGIDKTYFNIYKFRTMKNHTPHDVPTHMLENPEQYITRSGRFMRKTSLDELPQLINILKGEIDVVGPRPALWNQDDLIQERDRYQVNNIRPGLTGWAQVNGRDELELDEKARLDGEYVERMSLWMDIKIILRTILSIGGKDVVEGKTGVIR